jgi:hypothetical protein
VVESKEVSNRLAFIYTRRRHVRRMEDQYSSFQQHAYRRTLLLRIYDNDAPTSVGAKQKPSFVLILWTLFVTGFTHAACRESRVIKPDKYYCEYVERWASESTHLAGLSRIFSF